MATTINKTNGSVLATIADGAVDLSSTNLALIGRLYRNYGELVNENLVKLLENFANASSPSTPIVGQLWFDTTEKKIKVYRDTGFVPLSVTTTSTVEPSNPVLGDMWYDTVDAQLKTYTGATWTVIAPTYSASQGKSGAFAENITDTLSGNHIAVLIYQSGQVVAIFSNDNEYTPNTAITNFGSIKKGLNLSTALDIKMHGTATNAELLDSLDSTQFIRSDASDTATGTITIENAQPLVLGPNNEIEVNITSTNADFVKVNSGNIRFYTDNTELVMQLNDSRQVVVEAGSANNPSITFNGDTDSGMHWISPNVIGLSVGGTTRLAISNSGATVVGTLAADAITGNVTATSVSIGTLTAPIISGNTTITGNAIVNGNLEVDTNLTVDGNLVANGNVTLGNSSADSVLLNAATISAPNGITVTDGDLAVDGNIIAANELLVQYDGISGIASLRVDTSGRLLVNVAGPAVAASNTGDATFGDTAHIYAANTAKWWAVWRDNTNVAQFAFLGEHHVDSITRESSAGEYRINLDYNMTAGSYWAVVGMGAYGNMNMLEFPVGGAYVRVKNEIYDYTGTRDSSYNSVVAFGV